MEQFTNGTFKKNFKFHARNQKLEGARTIDKKKIKRGRQVTRLIMIYMSSSFGLLRVELRDFSQAKKKRAACKAEQIHKMTTIKEKAI